MSRVRSGDLDFAGDVARYLGMDMHFQPTLRVFGDVLGLAVLTARPSRLVKAGPLPSLARKRPIESRCAMWVAIEADRGELQLINTHMTLLSGRERLAQAEFLMGDDWLGEAERQGFERGDRLALPPRRRRFPRVALARN